jgi:hypothetical protein
MPLIKYKDKDSIPEDFRSAVKKNEDEGVYEVNVVLKSQLDEFRNNNIELSKKTERYKALENEFNALLTGEVTDVNGLKKEVSDLRKIAQRVKDGELTESSAIEKEVENRTKNMNERYEQQLKVLKDQLNAQAEKLKEKDNVIRENRLKNELKAIINDQKLGINPMAENALAMEAQRAGFRVDDDGNIIAKKENGDTIWGDNGKDPMTLREWADGQLKETAPYLFLKSQGSGTGRYGETGEGVPSAEARKKMTTDELWAATYSN